MSVIVTEVYDALVAAGAPDEKARAAAGVIPMTENLVTKQDLAEFRAEMKADFAEFKAEVKEEISPLKRDVAVLKLAMVSFMPAILALLAKLVFFP